MPATQFMTLENFVYQQTTITCGKSQNDVAAHEQQDTGSSCQTPPHIYSAAKDGGCHGKKYKQKKKKRNQEKHGV